MQMEKRYMGVWVGEQCEEQWASTGHEAMSNADDSRRNAGQPRETEAALLFTIEPVASAARVRLLFG